MLNWARLVAALALLVTLWPAPAGAQTKAGLVTNLEGSATAARGTVPQPLALKFKDDVFQNDRIVTGDRSIVRMLLGGKAVVTVRERSSLTITEVPGKATIDLDVGKIAVAVARERMKPGEQLEVKTPNAVAAVRGTVFIIEVIRATAQVGGGPGGVETRGWWFEGPGVINFAGGLVTMGDNTFASGRGNQPPTFIPVMNQQLRDQGAAGLALQGQNMAAGRQGTNEQVFGTTVVTFNQGAALPQVAGGGAPTPPPPTQITPTAPLLPGGATTFASTTSGTSAILGSSLVNGNFATGDFTGWTLAGAGAVLKQFGTLTPQSLTDCMGNSNCSSFFGLIHTATGVQLPGCGTGNACTRSTLSQSFNVGSSGILTFRGAGLLMSNEFPEFAGAGNPFNDQFIIRLVDSSGKTYTIAQKGVNDLVSSFTPSTFSATVGAFTLNLGAGLCQNNCKFAPNNKTVVVTPGTATLHVIVENVGDAAFDSAMLGAYLAVIPDPPQFFIQNGAFTRTDSAPLLQLTNASQKFDSLLMVCCNATASLAGPVLNATNSSLVAPFGLVSVLQGGTLTSTSTSPLVQLQGGNYSLGTITAIFDIAGIKTALDPATGLTLGTDQPLRHSGTFLDASGATITTQSAIQVDTALLEATAPLLNLAGGTSLTTTGNALDLVGNAKIAIPNDAIAMINLNASSLTVRNGNLVNVAGGSVLNVAGSLLSLSGGSIVNILNGLLLNVTGGSNVSVGRSLVSFSGGGNLLNVTNSFAPTAIIGGIPVYGPAESLRVTSPNALAGLGSAGAIRINGVALTPTTPLSALSGSLVAIQGNGSKVKIGK